MAESEWEKVGTVDVDAGLIWIGDPCYILDNDRPKAIGQNWSDICSVLDDAEYGPKQWDHDGGHAGLGVTVPSGLGDGNYDVFVKRVTLPGFGNRVTEVKIVFIDEDEL